MVAALQDDGAEVAEVPGEDSGVPVMGHRHHDQVGEVNAGVGVPFAEFESQGQLTVGWGVELVRTVEKGSGEDDRCGGVAAAAEQQVDLGDDRPGHERLSAETPEKLCGEMVPVAFVAVEGRDDRARVADGQLASRESTSSTRSDRSTSSAMIPA